MQKTYYWKVAICWMCSLNGEVRNAYIDKVLVGKTLRKWQLRRQWMTSRRILIHRLWR